MTRSPRQPSRLHAVATLAVALLSLAPGAARAEGRPEPLGFRASASLAGGGQPGAGSVYGGASLFELEGSLAYDVVAGIGPELALVLGMTPSAWFAVRPGLRWDLPGGPFHVRAAFDAATQGGGMAWRWFLLGGGFELRFTEAMGFFAEGDLGIPIVTAAGVALLVRAGAAVHF